MLLTCRQLAETLGVDYLQASSIIKVLISSGVGFESKSVKSGGRGRPTVTYEVPQEIYINLSTGKIREAG